MKTKAQKPRDAVIQYVKDIEDLSKKIEESVKKLDASSEKLLEYDYNGIEESEKALKQLKQQVDELYEKLKDQDKMIAKDPSIKTIGGYIKARYVKARYVGSVVDKAEEVIGDANKAIDRFRNAKGKFEEGLSDPYIGEMIRRGLKAEESRVKEMIEPPIDFYEVRLRWERSRFFDELLESGYPQERIYEGLKEELHLAELEISDKYEPVKAEIKKNLETPDKLVEFEKSEDPIVRGILAGSLRVTPNMPEELVKKIVEIAEALGNDPHWYVRAKLLENKELEHDLRFRARDAEVNPFVAFFNAVRDAENTNIKDIYENFEKLREKLKNDDPDWRVKIKAIS